MSNRYFDKFPIIEYNDFRVRDISRNVRITNDIVNSPTLFYPYEIRPGLRPDVLAHGYYDDSYMEWLIFLTNGITDPYYDWYLSENDFNDFIIKKYGSYENAVEKIKFYRVNWEDDRELTPSFYNNNLPDVLKKYYIPYYGYNSQVLSYVRRRDDWIVNTNKIFNLDISSANGTFTNEERVRTSSNGQAFVVTSNSTVVTVQHIEGTFTSNTTLTGNSSNATATITDVDIMYENITDEEYIYWTPVTCYDYEVELNESKKHIYMMDANYQYDVTLELKNKLKEEL